MRAGSACRLLISACYRDARFPSDVARATASGAILTREWTQHHGAHTAARPSAWGYGGAQATSPEGWATWLLALAAAAPVYAAADAPNRQQAAGTPTAAAAATAGGGADGASPPPPLTNHPLEYDPVTNEHTAKMTLARTAAIEFYNAGKYAQAESKFREAVAEAQLGFEAGDPHIASAKNNLAEFLRNTGRWDEAEQLYKEALDLLERHFGEKHWLYVSALHNLALSYEARGRTDAALAAMERVLGLRLAMFGPRHFLYADSLFALGHVLRRLPGRGGEALRRMEEAVRTLEEAEKVQVNVVLSMLTEIASCHTADGDPAAAAAALRRAVRHFAADRGDDAAAASALGEQLAEALAAAGRYGEAAEAAGETLAARRRVFGEGALVVATSELRVAQLQLLAAQSAQPAPAPAAGPGSESASGSGSGSGSAPGPGPALRALQHADSAFRTAAAAAEECGRRQLLTGPPADKLPKRLRAAHAMGAAAKLIATLAGVPEPAAAAAAQPPQDGRNEAAPAAAATSINSASTSGRGGGGGGGWSWWPFGGGRKGPAAAEGAAGGEATAAAAQGQGQGGDRQAAAAAAVLRPPPEPVAELAVADRRLEAAAAALTAATRAGQELLQAVSTGRRQLPQGLSADELAGLQVEAGLQLLDVLERLGLVLQARVAAGQGGQAGRSGGEGGPRGGGGGGGGGEGGDVVARHRAVLEQQERVAAALLG